MKKLSAGLFALLLLPLCALLARVCADMAARGVDTLYLLTDHTGFYERYGWEFLCMVQGDDEPNMTRMYIHR